MKAGPEGGPPPVTRAIKVGALGLVVAAGLALLGLVMYAYLTTQAGPYTPPISEVRTSEIVTRTSQGEFLNAWAPVRPDREAPLLGFRAPDFRLPPFTGSPIALSDLSGRPVLLNFWATWCPPCRVEMPDLQRFHEQYGDRIVVLGVNWNDEGQEARELLERYGSTYPNLIDQEGKVFVRYRLTGLPTSFWIDENGVIRGIWRGAMSLETMVDGFRKTTRVLKGTR